MYAKGNVSSRGGLCGFACALENIFLGRGGAFYFCWGFLFVFPGEDELRLGLGVWFFVWDCFVGLVGVGFFGREGV